MFRAMKKVKQEKLMRMLVSEYSRDQDKFWIAKNHEWSLVRALVKKILQNYKFRKKFYINTNLIFTAKFITKQKLCPANSVRFLPERMANKTKENMFFFFFYFKWSTPKTRKKADTIEWKKQKKTSTKRRT